MKNVIDETEFVEKVFEIAFGDDAISKDYSYLEVLEKLREFSDDSHRVLEMGELLDAVYPDLSNEEQTQENFDLKEKFSQFLGENK